MMGSKVANLFPVSALEVLSPMVVKVRDGQIVLENRVFMSAQVEVDAFVDSKSCSGRLRR